MYFKNEQIVLENEGVKKNFEKNYLRQFVYPTGISDVSMIDHANNIRHTLCTMLLSKSKGDC